MHDRIRPLPRLLSPRLPIGPRWEAFCRSGFIRHLRASARGAFVTVVALSAVVTFYVGLDAGWAVYTRLTGTV